MLSKPWMRNFAEFGTIRYLSAWSTCSNQFCSDECKRNVACSPTSGTCQLQVDSFVPGINILIFVTIRRLSVFFQTFFCFFQRQTKNPRNKTKLLWWKLIRKASCTRILIISRAINTWKSCEKGTRELNLTATIAVNVNRYTKLPTLSRRIAEPPNILRSFEVPASHSSIMGYIFGSPHFAMSNVNVSLWLWLQTFKR